MGVHMERGFTDATAHQTHLSTAELQKDVDVLLVFKVMGELDHVLMRQGFVELNLICDLWMQHNRVGIQMSDDKMEVGAPPSQSQQLMFA